MRMLQNTKGALNSAKIENYILIFVFVLVLFKVIAELFPDVSTAADDLNASGFPLATLFQSDGVLWYLVAAGLLFLVYKSFSGSSK